MLFRSVSQSRYATEQAIKSIVIDFGKEGFDSDDVETFLQMRIEFLIKKALATQANLFA